MTKRNTVVLALVVLLALSVTAFAVLPGSSSAPTSEEGTSFASFQLEVGRSYNPPPCPPIGGPGCG
jgi:hypothetical protein